MSDSRYRTSCDKCLISKVKCSQSKPSCSRCALQGQQCIYSHYRRIGRPPKRSATAVDEHAEPYSRISARRKEFNPTRTSKAIASNDQSLPVTDLNPTNSAQASSSHNDVESNIFDLLQDTDATICWPHENLTTSFSASGQSGMMPEFDFLNYVSPGNLSNTIATSDLQGSDGHHNSPSLTPSSSAFIDFPPTIEASRRSSNFDSDILGTHQIVGESEGQQTAPTVSMRRFSVPNSTTNPLCSLPSPVSSVRSRPNHFVSPFKSSHNGRNNSDIPPITSSQFDSRTSRTSTQPDLERRCFNQCHATLTEQLTRLNEFKSKNHTKEGFDVILTLEASMRNQREQILSCRSCLDTSRSGQTLVLVTMVLENLLTLFEEGINIDNTPLPMELEPGRAVIEAHPTFPAHPSHQEKKFARRTFLRSGSLTVGDLEVDEAVRTTLSWCLLRLFLRRQMNAAVGIDRILEMAVRDVNFKVAKEILRNVEDRIEVLQGWLVLMR